MAILKFKSTVRTDKIGSECKFTFKIDEEDLPEDPGDRDDVIHELAKEALWDSGTIYWSYEQVEDEGTP
jgi:hypothetical protein